ncbi:MAG: hypothetical protein HRU35_00215 [Rickettsiaceae bacterium]|nr:hypothetical protein [Rickettsiaceae bacterium]
MEFVSNNSKNNIIGNNRSSFQKKILDNNLYMYRIAIIGGGAVGIGCLYSLVNKLSKYATHANIQITLYEKTENSLQT